VYSPVCAVGRSTLLPLSVLEDVVVFPPTKKEVPPQLCSDGIYTQFDCLVVHAQTPGMFS